MAFDLAAMRGMMRFLVSDPNGDAVDAATLLGTYLNPTYQDWWQRMERRPGVQIPGTAALFAANDRIQTSVIPVNTASMIEHLFVNPTITGGTLICAKGDFNRIRALQESEGLTGIPREIGLSFVFNDPVLLNTVSVVFAPYPIPSEATNIFVYGADSYTPLVIDTDSMLIDPVSARYVTRLAAYRMAISAYDLPPNRMAAILSGVPGWVKAAFQIDLSLHNQGRPQELAPHARPEGFDV